MTVRAPEPTRIAHLSPESCAARSGLSVGDVVLEVNGVVPRDVLEWSRLAADHSVHLVVERDGHRMEKFLVPRPGEPLGISLDSAVFDRVSTCDNHCEFCFIYQLPKGMRRSLYLKDDDYRLSFLFGNFTTLTRFTEADLERVIDEGLSPLYVSIHSSDPRHRAEMLRNDRGGTSLRWLRLILDAGISVRAQIVLCPGVNDGASLDRTLAGILEQFPEIESVAIVPVGLSKHNTEARMRVHSTEESRRAIEQVFGWQSRFREVLGRNPIHLSDEFYLAARTDVPEAEHYGDYGMLEDGVGIVRSFVDSFTGGGMDVHARRDGFFAHVDGPSPTDYVRASNPAADTSLRIAPTPVVLRARVVRSNGPVTVLTGSYAAPVLRALLASHGFRSVEVREVPSVHFGGNTAVAGLMTHADITRVLREEDMDRRFLLPDVCLNDGRFLDGPTIDDLRRQIDVEVLPTIGSALRARLETLEPAQ